MGCKNISPVCFYISTRVNVSFLVSSYFIPNLPLLTIVNRPTIFKPFAPPVFPYLTLYHIHNHQFLKKFKNTNYKYNKAFALLGRAASEPCHSF